MIDVDKIFEQLFDTIPQHYSKDGVLVDKVFYHSGDQKELDNVLITRQHNQKKAYPLVWYKLPNELTGNEQFIKGDFEFVVAMNTELDWLNDQRFEFSYRQILYPISELIIQAFKGAKNIQLLQQSDKMYWKTTDFPNYGSLSSETPQDYWDAMLLKVKLTIDNNCMGKINYKLKNFNT